MNRNEAVSYLKELLSNCNDMSPNSVSFENRGNADPADYSVRIKGSIHDFEREILRSIATKHSLEVKDDHDSVIIY